MFLTHHIICMGHFSHYIIEYFKNQKIMSGFNRELDHSEVFAHHFQNINRKIA